MNALGFIADHFNFPGINFVQAFFEYFAVVSHFAFGVGYLEADNRKGDVTSPYKMLSSFLLIRPMKSSHVFLEESLSLFIGRDGKEGLFEGGRLLYTSRLILHSSSRGKHPFFILGVVVSI